MVLLKKIIAAGTATIDDVRAEIACPVGVNPKVFGAVPGPLAKKGIIKLVGFAKTKLAKEADLVLEKESRIDGKLTKDNPKVENRSAEKHQIKMSPDRTYVIDLESADFDAYRLVRQVACALQSNPGRIALQTHRQLISVPGQTHFSSR